MVAYGEIDGVLSEADRAGEREGVSGEGHGRSGGMEQSQGVLSGKCLWDRVIADPSHLCPD